MKLNFLLFCAVLLLSSCQEDLLNVNLSDEQVELNKDNEATELKKAKMDCDCKLIITELGGHNTAGRIVQLVGADECGSTPFEFNPFTQNPQEFNIVFEDLNWPNFECLDIGILNGAELILHEAETTNSSACYDLGFLLDCGSQVATLEVSRQDGMGLRLFEVVSSSTACDANVIHVCHPPIPNDQYCAYCE